MLNSFVGQAALHRRSPRTELLCRMQQSAESNPRPPIPADKMFSELHKQISEPRRAPARWQRANRHRSIRVLSAPEGYYVAGVEECCHALIRYNLFERG